MNTQAAYPERAADRDRWIVERRGERAPVDARIPYAFLVEEERFATGDVGPVATLFLTNRECPWRCAMCDLWRHTLKESVAPGAIPAQIDYALARLPAARHVKLYNSGSFFDRGAIPREDYGAIAGRMGCFERVIVESHPALVHEDCYAFASLLAGQLEVAMGLETAHPAVLAKLNKKMTLAQYASAAERLARRGIDLRSFILVQPPFLRREEALHWACRSIDFALECGATAVTLLPTRGGNGAMEELAQAGEFVAPSLRILEDALDYGVSLGRERIFADLWEMHRVAHCATCAESRRLRLARMNLEQVLLPRVGCEVCEARA